MKIKDRLNLIAILGVGTITLLTGFIWFNTIIIEEELEKIKKLNSFSRNATELYAVSDQFMSYSNPEHLKIWEKKYDELQKKGETLEELSDDVAFRLTLPTIKKGFSLIRDVKTNNDGYTEEQRNYLLEKARSRLRADVQLLVSLTHKMSEKHHAKVRALKVDQRLNFLFFVMIPSLFLIGIVNFQARNRIVKSLNKLLVSARRIQEGNFDERVKITAKDEHGELANQFNMMAEKVEELVKKEKNSRLQAEESRENWKQLVYHIPNLVMITIDKKIKFINPAGPGLYGTETTRDLIGTNIDNFLEKPETEKAQKRLKKILGNNSSLDPAIYLVKNKNGQSRYLHIESAPITFHGQNAVLSVGTDLTEQVLYEEKLKASLEEKDTLLKEVHHRVKNNLAVVSSLLQMQRFKAGDDNLKKILRVSELRIQSMAMVHENLYQTDSLSNIDFETYLSKITEAIQQTFDPDRKITIHVKCKDVLLNVNTAMPCAFIINELLTNSFKHGFDDTEQGRIDVEAEINDDNRISFYIKDNGKGIPEHFDPKSSTSLGFTIINLLTKQLKADFEIKNKLGTYARFSFAADS